MTEHHVKRHVLDAHVWHKLSASAIDPGHAYLHDFEQAGYVQVHLDEHVAFSNWKQIHSWCEQHCECAFTWFYGTFVFESDQDAVKFSLAWT